ncbi:SET domain-containing protein [Fuerstiella marisgermanici]|uniref:SET domain protein n=1 Tax=Fuerstiella marisgermanici TaxID=1891926 RepID=A0A1P8WRJ6_9PLAN|nr:SET domain-containing protein [Fuerstiella marisgermanici]APZ96681.1 SET domain protein [Fuerstiella marisgermanici]
MPIYTSPHIEVKQTKGKGRGVFARSFIPEGTEFERVPVIVMPDAEVLGPEGSVLANYVFEWGRGTVAMALGFGSMYNHSYSANARYDDVGRQTKVYTALRDILPGEEITINYNGDENDMSPVGFEVDEEVPSQEPVSA